MVKSVPHFDNFTKWKILVVNTLLTLPYQNVVHGFLSVLSGFSSECFHDGEHNGCQEPRHRQA